MLKKLHLKDSELDDVVLPKDDFAALKEEARWMALVKVHTRRTYSRKSFYSTMDVAWNFAREWMIRPVGGDLYVLQVSCLGDWKRLTEESPWMFRDMGLIIEPYDGIADPTSVVLDRLAVWVQIHNIPPLFRKKELVEDLAARVGTVLAVEMYAPSLTSANFVRARVKIDINSSLTRFVSITPEGERRQTYCVLFEKLPRFCEACGMIGYDSMICGDGVHDQRTLEYGDWMIAPFEDWRRRTPGAGPWFQRGRNEGRGNRGGRGGRNPGRNGGRGQRAKEQEAVRQEKAPDNVGTENSSAGEEVKDSAETEKEIILRKRCLSDAGLVTPVKNYSESIIVNDPLVRRNLALALVGDGSTTQASSSSGEGESVPPLPPVYISPRGNKKKAKNQTTMTAASQVEGRGNQ
ncbi:hypothetical protein VPH35_091074 [Triticum aestivum]